METAEYQEKRSTLSKKKRHTNRKNKEKGSTAFDGRKMMIEDIKARCALRDKGEEKRAEDAEIVRFRHGWESSYGRFFGSFEDTTIVPPMCYTFGSVPEDAAPDNTLQIFSVKVAQLKEEEGLHWPLHIYGFIVIRDSIDPRRNFIFHRARDNCQTITKEEPSLLLTGPSRVAVLIDPVSFEVQLKVKGETESEDKVLIFNVFTTRHPSTYLGHPPPIFTRDLNGNRADLEFTFALLARSVEATISAQVVAVKSLPWPETVPGRITARTASIDHRDIVLVDSGVGKMPIRESGVIKLSRHVVSVEFSGELKVVVEANYYGELFKHVAVFTPKISGISYKGLDMPFCRVGITVGWSLFQPVVPEQSGRAV